MCLRTVPRLSLHEICTVFCCNSYTWSSTKTNSQELIFFDDGERKAASFNTSIFSDSTFWVVYLRMLRWLLNKSIIVFSAKLIILKKAPQHEMPFSILFSDRLFTIIRCVLAEHQLLVPAHGNVCKGSLDVLSPLFQEYFRGTKQPPLY